MKKLFNFIILIFLFIITFAQSSFAQDYKITSVNFDTSNSIIFLTTQETIDEPILKSVKFVKMENPTRAYFDIDSSVLTIPKQDWTFTANGLKKVKVNQFSTNPNVVRVVMYFEDVFDLSYVHF